ncbi:class I SAM-dependent methyltransferase [bacterium]|nr:class I SAM-dependent methyltransferase [bacterium]
MGLKKIINGTLRRFGYEIRRTGYRKHASDTMDAGSESTATQEWSQPFDVLRRKWNEVPTSRAKRQKTQSLYKLSDEKLRHEWLSCRTDITTGTQFRHRGWYHALYADSMNGKKVLDVGSGFAIDSITYALHGAKVTFVDIHESNLNVLKRLCAIFEIGDARFCLLENMESLTQLDTDYDVIMAMGSLHHAPVTVIRPEVNELIRHLRIGGRWLQLAYPRTRWEREGSPSFGAWGEMTDGAGTPWAEWYDVDKLLGLFDHAQFEVVLCREFHDSDFIWFDLLYTGNGGA